MGRCESACVIEELILSRGVHGPVNRTVNFDPGPDRIFRSLNFKDRTGPFKKQKPD